jgi:cellulose biosynthesis protein BcsQ
MTTKLCLFNHKGGVGKTTLTFNIVRMLVSKGHKVLVVDSDPQCNLSTYILNPNYFDTLLDQSDSPNGQTIWSAVKPVSEGSGLVNIINPFSSLGGNLLLLPGDIRLAIFERDLHDFFAECYQRRVRGFRGTAAISTLVDSICAQYNVDYVFYDTGPNIGALNHAILLDCDFFIVPVSSDEFSMRAIKTLGASMRDWILEWDTVQSIAPRDIPVLSGKPKFGGYINHMFRIYRGSPSTDHLKAQRDIEREILEQLVSPMREIDEELTPILPWGNKLGEVQNFSSLASKSIAQGRPFYLLDATGGRDEVAFDTFNDIADRISQLHADQAGGGRVGYPK